ncbi:nuclear transport factor 2 family protein [Streptomyces sp. NBC_01622]|uniref:nuclear transport factor 2 family protein n=1 Tax=Streptomyces sp. NBC_01622 TaxID=2975903 RepID=UPI00386329EE|nr:nuclear transport factor 2 family protein [Streptomyces sp. NBC_01622]
MPNTDTKQTVLDFFDLLLVKKDPAAAAARYIGSEGYIQHNPGVASGPASQLVEAIDALFARHPDWSTEIKRVLADGDLVAVHHHVRAEPGDAGLAVVDIFRVRDGRLVEHWDVIQPVPSKAQNDNTMF